jgi:hypothetical protein
VTDVLVLWYREGCANLRAVCEQGQALSLRGRFALVAAGRDKPCPYEVTYILKFPVFSFPSTGGYIYR